MKIPKRMTRAAAAAAMFNEEIGLTIISKVLPAALGGDIQAAQAFALLNLGRHLGVIRDRMGTIAGVLNDIHAKPKIPTTDIRGIATYTKEAAHALNDVRDLLDKLNRMKGL